jgi:hypothetical protein
MSVIAVVMTLALVAQITTPVDRASQTAEVFWDQFTAVQCLERVTQTRIQSDGKAESSRTSEFDYVAFVEAKASGIAVQESRVARAKTSADDSEQLLLTSGFPALLLMFHPDVRQKFEFAESPSPDTLPGTVRIAFKSKPGERSMSAVKLKERLYPILWQGFAWIEEKTGNIAKIEATLASPMEDLGLSELRAEVDYKMVPLPNSTASYQLPARVTVSVRTAKRQWRNVHDYSEYRLFTVTTSTRSEPGTR